MEKRKDVKKSIILLSGIIACLLMIAIILYFLSNTITGNSIKLKDQERLQQPNNDSNESNNPLSGDGNAYVCVDSEGNIFRSETPCK